MSSALWKKLNLPPAGDVVLWFAYPKRTAKHIASSIHRDTGWDTLGALGFEPVRQVALDEHWSALRFRNVRHIATMQRDPARTLSREGRTRAQQARANPSDTR